MSLQGLPDLQGLVRYPSAGVYRPFELRGPWAVLPSRLDVSLLPDGRPDFLLSLVRRQNPNEPVPPKGVLHFRIGPVWPLEQALAVVRQTCPTASIAPIRLAGGTLRFQAVGALEVPPELLAPVPLGWDSFNVGVFPDWVLSPAAATLVKSCLAGGSLPLTAHAEIEFAGVAPRVGVRVRFSMKELAVGLAPILAEGRLVTRTDLAAFFRRDPDSLPIRITGGLAEEAREDFANAMTDRLRTWYGTIRPSTACGAESSIDLADVLASGDGVVEWDLSEPVATSRPLGFDFDPLGTARELALAQGLAGLCREVEPPPIVGLPPGHTRVFVSANLPVHRPGVLAVGVNLKAQPAPPHRPQAILKTMEFQPPRDEAETVMEFSGHEKPEYQRSAYTLIEGPGGFVQLDGPEVPCQGDRIYLGPEDFPVDFIKVAASPNLADVAGIQGYCRWSVAGCETRQQFELTANARDVGLAVPKEGVEAFLGLRVVSRAGEGEIVLPEAPASNVLLDLFSFREYGPHTVKAECSFEKGAGVFAIEIVPEGRPDSDAEVLHFTPQQPLREWTYYATSLFRSGYRFRVRDGAGAEKGAWSVARSPFEVLSLFAG